MRIDIYKIAKYVEIFFSCLIRKPYNYIGECPCCNSDATGYYVKEDMIQSEFGQYSGLKNGELVLEMPRIPEKNAFCAVCGFEWAEQPQLKWLTIRQIQKERVKRCTDEVFNSMYRRREKRPRWYGHSSFERRYERIREDGEAIED